MTAERVSPKLKLSVKIGDTVYHDVDQPICLYLTPEMVERIASMRDGSRKFSSAPPDQVSTDEHIAWMRAGAPAWAHPPKGTTKVLNHATNEWEDVRCDP